MISGIYQNTIRSRLPRKLGSYNGVVARKPRLLDDDTYPDHKAPYMQYIREYVEEGQTVVEVGGGFGIGTVAIAEAVGDDGNVITYEPAHDMRLRLRETLRLNGVANHDIDIRGEVVGPAIDVWDDGDVETDVPAGELPACDVLVLDCEGSEAAIIDDLGCGPDVVIVEAHRLNGTEPHGLTDRLRQQGFEIASQEWRWVVAT